MHESSRILGVSGTIRPPAVASEFSKGNGGCSAGGLYYGSWRAGGGRASGNGEAEQHVGAFLSPLLSRLDLVLDRRLVRTVLRRVVAIICWRNRAHGLVLAELGAYITSPAQAPAGTKRLSNLLCSAKWTGRVIEQYLWQQATARVEAAGASVYAAWGQVVPMSLTPCSCAWLPSAPESVQARAQAARPGYRRGSRGPARKSSP
jgi:hypothetical protein